MAYLLGADIGTLSTKIVIVDEFGNVFASVSRDHEVIHPQPGWAEHDPEKHWWQDFVLLTRQALAESGINSTEIEAIGVVGAFPSPCITTKEGIPLRSAILYSDNRSEQILYEISQDWELNLNGDDITPRLLWIKRNEPNLLARTEMILNAHSFIVYRLTGVYSIDFANASWFGGLYDYKLRGWNAERCAELGLSLTTMPPIYSADSVVGVVGRAAAMETGLTQGTPVVTGSGDMYMALLGSGAISPNDAIIYYGTAGLLLLNIRPFMEIIGRPFPDQRQDLALLIAYIQANGESIRWFSQLLGQRLHDQAQETGISNYAILDNEASKLPMGSEGVQVLPHFLGERSPEYNPKARGCIYGLTPDHSAAHIHRAILESFGFGIKHALMNYPTEHSSIRTVFACGGGARSPLWRQIISDILDLRQEYNPKASSALGSAYLAGMGIGNFSDCETIRHKWLQSSIETIPSQPAKAVYDEYFERYLALYRAMKNMKEDLVVHSSYTLH